MIGVARSTMLSERQLEANRRNAAKSHGPITPEGRAAVRHNALKHGFTAAEIILPTVEETIDFEQFRFALRGRIRPRRPHQASPGRRHGRLTLATQPHSQDGTWLLRHG